MRIQDDSPRGAGNGLALAEGRPKDVTGGTVDPFIVQRQAPRP